MTAQVAERLIIDGNEYAMCAQPLGMFHSLGGILLQFDARCSALWRGYVGTWEILDGRLYMTGLSGSLEDGTEANLGMQFPGYPDRVFAHWYTGTLRIPKGKLLEYVHSGYASRYDQDWLITLENGVVIGEEIKTNGVAENENGPEGYGVGAFTVFGRKNEGEDDHA